jgi:methylglutaconyl-CoA hydratase
MFYSLMAIGRFARVKFNFIEVEESGHLFKIILNRPDKRNAFTPTMVNELAYALAYAQTNKDIWCVMVEANGPVFCSGMDLNVFQNPELDHHNPTLPEPKSVITIGDAFRALNKPSIAKIQGAVMAGGFLVVGGCTFAVATADVQFSLPEVKRGIFPLQVISTLLNITSPRKAMQMCILAETFSAEKALEIGIVSHLCVKENIDETCQALVNTIISHSPYAIGKGFEAFRALESLPEYAQYMYLADQLAKIRVSDDAKEGIDAFREKRNAVWKNQ